MNDPRLGRFFAIDPLASKYPYNSPYAFSENSTIAFIELEGLEKYYSADGIQLGQVGNNNDIRIINENLTNETSFELIRNAVVPMRSAASATQSLLDFSTSITDYAENIDDVLGGADIVEYTDNCFKAANTQLRNAGLKQQGPYTAIQTRVDNDKQIDFHYLSKSGEQLTKKRKQLSENVVGGAIYTMTQLKKGNAVMFGVDTRASDVGNYNAITNHFVVVSGMVKGKKSILFEYYESVPPSKENYFIFDLNNLEIYDNKSKVSEVRKNVEK
jgi:hypothetical protein